jgi:hypothetical protein
MASKPQSAITAIVAITAITAITAMENIPTIKAIATGGQFYKTFYSCKLQIFVIIKSICSWEAFPVKSNVCG